LHCGGNEDGKRHDRYGDQQQDGSSKYGYFILESHCNSFRALIIAFSNLKEYKLILFFEKTVFTHSLSEEQWLTKGIIEACIL